MNYGFKGFQHSFRNFGNSQRTFSGNFYKNMFKNKSVLNAFNSNLNKGKCLINMSNKFFMDRAIFLTNNSSSLVNKKSGFGTNMLTGEENTTEFLKIENDDIQNVCGIDMMNKLSFFFKYGKSIYFNISRDDVEVVNDIEKCIPKLKNAP
jgi:hypothetical protein